MTDLATESPAALKDAALKEVADLKATHARVFAQSVRARQKAINTSCRTCKASLRRQRERLLDKATQVRHQMHDAARLASARGATRAELGAALGCSQSTLSLILAAKTATIGGS